MPGVLLLLSLFDCPEMRLPELTLLFRWEAEPHASDAYLGSTAYYGCPRHDLEILNAFLYGRSLDNPELIVAMVLCDYGQSVFLDNRNQILCSGDGSNFRGLYLLPNYRVRPTPGRIWTNQS